MLQSSLPSCEVSVQVSIKLASGEVTSSVSPPHVSRGGLTPGDMTTNQRAGGIRSRSNLMSPPRGQSF